MKTTIVFSGHLGATKNVAELIKKELNEVDVFDTRQNFKIDFKNYDKIVLGTNVRMSLLNRRFKKFVKKFKRQFFGKKVFVYICAASKEQEAQAYVEKVKKLLPNAKIYFVGGFFSTENAKGLIKKIIESIIKNSQSNNEPLPQLLHENINALISELKWLWTVERENWKEKSI